MQTTLKYKKLQEFGGWLTGYGSYLNGWRSLALETIFAFKSQSIENN